MAGNVGWSVVVLPLLAGAGLSFLVESLLRPRILAFWKRQSATLLIHIGLWLLLFAFELAVFRRPWFATIIALAFLLVVVQVSNAKFYSLREPFVFQDFEYFTDALKYPRLYLPFLGVGRALIIAIGFGVALYAGLTLEPSLTHQVSTAEFFIMVFVLLIIGATLLGLGARQKLKVTFDPKTDLQQLGLMASLWRYGEEEYDNQSVPSLYDFLEPAPLAPEALPNLVVVQSESFFDARELFSGIRQEVLREFDSLKASAVCQGQVEVSAWGANTVRTEFAFLSGLASKLLGVHRFNPYRKLARQGIPTLAGFLKRLGYRTVCVHPYQAGFYARDTVFPLLGFDEFIDIKSFNGIKKTGPYIGDVALAEKVCTLLEASSTQPIFVFVITMENHGPLHLEKVQEGDVERLYSNPPPDECDDLTIYLRHLSNADRMAGMLRNRLETLPGNSWLCWYGDHVPIMPKVYGKMGVPEGQTDYFIWEKGASFGKENRLDIKIENMGCLLLQKMGLLSILIKNNSNMPVETCNLD
ncbi:MAG: LTA synthase family protein [Methylococcaceae bacterium]